MSERVSSQGPPTCARLGKSGGHVTGEFPVNYVLLQSNQCKLYPFLSVSFLTFSTFQMVRAIKKTWSPKIQEKWEEALSIRQEHIQMC